MTEAYQENIPDFSVDLDDDLDDDESVFEDVSEFDKNSDLAPPEGWMPTEQVLILYGLEHPYSHMHLMGVAEALAAQTRTQLVAHTGIFTDEFGDKVRYFGQPTISAVARGHGKEYLGESAPANWPPYDITLAELDGDVDRLETAIAQFAQDKDLRHQSIVIEGVRYCSPTFIARAKELKGPGPDWISQEEFVNKTGYTPEEFAVGLKIAAQEFSVLYRARVLPYIVGGETITYLQVDFAAALDSKMDEYISDQPKVAPSRKRAKVPKVPEPRTSPEGTQSSAERGRKPYRRRIGRTATEPIRPSRPQSVSIVEKPVVIAHPALPHTYLEAMRRFRSKEDGGYF